MFQPVNKINKFIIACLPQIKITLIFLLSNLLYKINYFYYLKIVNRILTFFFICSLFSIFLQTFKYPFFTFIESSAFIFFI